MLIFVCVCVWGGGGGGGGEGRLVGWLVAGDICLAQKSASQCKVVNYKCIWQRDTLRASLYIGFANPVLSNVTDPILVLTVRMCSTCLVRLAVVIGRAVVPSPTMRMMPAANL